MSAHVVHSSSVDIVSTEKMSLAGEFDSPLSDASREPKTEDASYDGQHDSNQDLDMDDKPGADEESAMSPEPDAEMEDLFGDDKPAEEVSHHRERCVV